MAPDVDIAICLNNVPISCCCPVQLLAKQPVSKGTAAIAVLHKQSEYDKIQEWLTCSRLCTLRDNLLQKMLDGLLAMMLSNAHDHFLDKAVWCIERHHNHRVKTSAGLG